MPATFAPQSNANRRRRHFRIPPPSRLRKVEALTAHAHEVAAARGPFPAALIKHRPHEARAAGEMESFPAIRVVVCPALHGPAGRKARVEAANGRAAQAHTFRFARLRRESPTPAHPTLHYPNMTMVLGELLRGHLLCPGFLSLSSLPCSQESYGTLPALRWKGGGHLLSSHSCSDVATVASETLLESLGRIRRALGP